MNIFPHRILRTGMYALIIGLFMLSMASLSVNGASASPRTAAASIGGCPLFPSNNIWNADISRLPVSANSANYVASIGLSGHLHPDFGSGLYNGAPIGFPYVVVPASQKYVPVSFQYASESDPGPYPIPANAPIEGGPKSTGDRHVLVVDSGTCKLYEMFASYPQKDGSWHAGSGAVWNLNSNTLRPSGWTSADAAGLPILPGLVSYNEVASGVINHALRFTVNQTQAAFLWPARHFASSSHNSNLPPMGLRLRLKSNVNISSFSRIDQIILTALKHYGMFVADNGSSWFLSGMSDNRWNNDDLHALTSIPGSDFEVVDESSLEINANSGQAKGLPSSTPAPTPTVSPTHSPTPTHVPHQADTLAAEVKAIHPIPAANSNSATSKSGNTGNRNMLLPVSVSISFLLALAGTMLLFRHKKRTRANH